MTLEGLNGSGEVDDFIQRMFSNMPQIWGNLHSPVKTCYAFLGVRMCRDAAQYQVTKQSEITPDVTQRSGASGQIVNRSFSQKQCRF